MSGAPFFKPRAFILWPSACERRPSFGIASQRIPQRSRNRATAVCSAASLGIFATLLMVVARRLGAIPWSPQVSWG